MFVNGQFQSAVRHHMDEPGNDYRPGNCERPRASVYATHGSPRWVPQLQVNLVHKAPDQGALADIQSTAGTVRLREPRRHGAVGSLHVFGLVQLPAYSNLYGYQLFPHYTASVGASYGF